MPEIIRIGTRRSTLALWQARLVAGMLEQSGMKTEIIGIETRGDRVLDVAIAKIGDKGVFTRELEDMLRAGAVDIAVHSAKDLPSELSPGFELIAFTRREKAQDVFVGRRSARELEEPGSGLRVGSSSVRRTAFLKRYYPHLRVVDMRGNLQTRIGKMQTGACDLLILAFAGVHRMGYDHLIVQELPIDRIVPPPGQGSLAVETSLHLASDRKRRVREIVNHPETEKVILAERAFLKTLKGGCGVPAFGHAILQGGRVHLTGGLISLDGRELIRECRQASPDESEALGAIVAEEVLQKGGRRLLEEIAAAQGAEGKGP